MPRIIKRSKNESFRISLKDGDEKVKNANESPCGSYFCIAKETEPFISFETCCCIFSIQCLVSADLLEEDKHTIAKILVLNMKELYDKSSWGWNEAEKVCELFAPESRFLLCRFLRGKEKCSLGRHEPPISNIPTDPCGFVHFRFEMDSSRPVLYCYEIQLSNEVRGVKLGQQLMHLLEGVAERAAMSHLMLTVFKFNQTAYGFFGRFGFKIDSSDPYKHGKFMDYSIMSKRISKRNHD